MGIDQTSTSASIYLFLYVFSRTNICTDVLISNNPKGVD